MATARDREDGACSSSDGAAAVAAAARYAGPRRMSLEPRRDQYQKHSLLQQRTIGGLSELEAMLMEETHRRKSSISGGLQPRTVQYENHPLFERNESGLTEFEACLNEHYKDRKASGKPDDVGDSSQQVQCEALVCDTTKEGRGGGEGEGQALLDGAEDTTEGDVSKHRQGSKSVRFTGNHKQSSDDVTADRCTPGASDQCEVTSSGEKSCKSGKAVANILRRQSAPEEGGAKKGAGNKHALSDSDTDNGKAKVKVDDDNANPAPVSSNPPKLSRDASCIIC